MKREKETIYENEIMADSRSSVSTNIIRNHDFSKGLSHWEGHHCQAYIVKDEDGTNYANIPKRKRFWHSLQQDITGQVSTGLRYQVSAFIRISGSKSSDNINAKVKLNYQGDKQMYHNIEGFKTRIPEGKWCKLKGEFVMPPWPEGNIFFYIFGPQPGVDLQVKSVEFFCLDSPQTDIASRSDVANGNPIPRLTGGNQNRSTSGDGKTNSGITGSNQSLNTSTVQGANTNNISVNITIDGRSLGATDGVGNDPNSAWAKFGSFLRGLLCFACAI